MAPSIACEFFISSSKRGKESAQASGNAATHVPLTRNFSRFTPKESLITVYTIYHVWRHVTMVALFLADNETDGDGKENGKKY